MLKVATVEELAARAGTLLGHSDWLTIDQRMVDAFAGLTGDTHWIHVDTDRAAREMPGGRTIAHGLLLLGLIPDMQKQVYQVRQRGIGLNYGYDRIRFVSQVPVGSRVRLALTLESIEPHAQGTRVITTAAIEVDGSTKPALVAQNILLIMEPKNA